MALAEYQLLIMREDRSDWESSLMAALNEELASSSYPQELLESVDKVENLREVPRVAVYLGSEPATKSARCDGLVAAAKHRLMTIIPVFEPGTFGKQVPKSLSEYNGFEVGQGRWPRLARTILRELGLSERVRRVFISYRREDGAQIALQLFDSLTRRGFNCFLDAFSTQPGENWWDRIRDALESSTFLLLVESPRAWESKWVTREVHYAVLNNMGWAILALPGVLNRVPGSEDFPRISVDPAEIVSGLSGVTLSPSGQEEVVEAIESNYAAALTRRRSNIFSSVERILSRRYPEVTVMPGWRLLARGPSVGSLLAGIVPGIPDASDLHQLATLSISPVSSTPSGAPAGRGGMKILIYSSSFIPPEKAQLIGWVAQMAKLDVVHSTGVEFVLP